MFKKVGPYGSLFGNNFDDYADVKNYVIAREARDGLRKVGVKEDGERVSYVEFVYAKGTELIPRSYGKKRDQELKEFTLDHERDEYVKSVEGTYDEDGFVSSLTFITSKERKSEEFGKAVGTKFVIEAKGFDRLFVFFGRSSDDGIHALGAHFKLVLDPPVDILDAKGGNKGEAWNDGIHDNVREIEIHSNSCVNLVKFKYVNGSTIFAGEAHGTISHCIPAGKKMFLLDEDEYITSVKGYYAPKVPHPGNIFYEPWDSKCTYMTMLTFNTNKTTYKVLGENPSNIEIQGTPFVLEKEGHKIVGFHGRFMGILESIGAYVKPIINS